MNCIVEQRWTIKHIRDGKVIWELHDKKNIVPDSGEKAILEVFYRNKASAYFATANFYTGLYKGTVTESTVLATIPNEPSGNGYSRKAVERSSVGWPTIEKDDGDWRVVSKDVEILAVGGDIGPVNGAFIGTSLDDSGALVGAISFAVERTVKAGDTMILNIRVKHK